MKKLLLILLCVPLIFSCGEKEKDEKIKELQNKIKDLENDKSLLPKDYFIQFLVSKDHHKMIQNSFPSLLDCKKVLNEPYASNYYKSLSWYKKYQDTTKLTNIGHLNHTYNQDIKDRYNSFLIDFKDVTYNIFNTNEIDNPNWKGYFLPNIDFYEVIFLREVGGKDIDDFDITDTGYDNDGLEYLYFTNINGKWLFFPKLSNEYYENAL